MSRPRTHDESPCAAAAMGPATVCQQWVREAWIRFLGSVSAWAYKIEHRKDPTVMEAGA